MHQVRRPWCDQRTWQRSLPDLAVVEVQDGDAGGPGLLADLARWLAVPIIAVGPDDTELHASMLEAGADCYLTDSEVERLLAPQIESMVRRSARGSPPRRLFAGDLCVDVEAHSAFTGRSELWLSRVEFDLLQALLQRPGAVCGRAQLQAAGGAGQPLSEHALESHIWRLRRKLQQRGSQCQIKAEVGVGYRLVAPASRDRG